MRRRTLSVVVLPILLLLAACGREVAGAPPEADARDAAARRIESLEAENRALRRRGGELPASLDRWYPPASDGPVYHLAMLAMAERLDAVVCDVTEGDLAGARAGYAQLEERYLALADMVPEWASDFPPAPLAALEAALASGEVGRIMPAIDGVGQACAACHADRMVPAQQRYHWGDFRSLRLDDEATGGELPMPAFMRGLALHMTGVMHDLSQGQLAASRDHLRRLRAAFDELGAACSACHATPRAYYVDDRVRGLLDDMTEQLEKPSPDAEAMGRLTSSLGVHSCLPCHRVHVPAAFSRAAAASR